MIAVSQSAKMAAAITICRGELMPMRADSLRDLRRNGGLIASPAT